MKSSEQAHVAIKAASYPITINKSNMRMNLLEINYILGAWSPEACPESRSQPSWSPPRRVVRSPMPTCLLLPPKALRRHMSAP